MEKQDRVIMVEGEAPESSDEGKYCISICE